jgi:hypothetical protein
MITMGRLPKKAAENLSALKEIKPLIHNITNFVVMNYTANALLAMGASPVMAHADGSVQAYRKTFLPNFGPFDEGGDGIQHAHVEFGAGIAAEIVVHYGNIVTPV